VPTSPTPHVVIIGGGFGGLFTARALDGAPVKVTLLDRHNYHLFQPLLCQVATARHRRGAQLFRTGRLVGARAPDCREAEAAVVRGSGSRETENGRYANPRTAKYFLSSHPRYPRHALLFRLCVLCALCVSAGVAVAASTQRLVIEDASSGALLDTGTCPL
jgi:choline dehydrogenase-like flavoprotein